MTRSRAIQAMLREAARDALDAANWLKMYEARQHPESRVHAARCLMDARETLARAEAALTAELASETQAVQA